MNEMTLAIFSIGIYLSTVGFFWGIYRENCSANPAVLLERSLAPTRPALQDFLNLYWRPLALFGVLFLGTFGFFIEHVCDYP